MKEKIMPTLVLSLICIIIAALLAVVYQITYVDTTGVMTDKLESACVSIFGDGEYTMLTTPGEDDKKIPVTYGEASCVISGGENRYLFQVTVDGYEKNGITLLIGVENGAVTGMYPLTVNETAGLGAKVKKQDFLARFKGADSNTDLDSIDGITSATLSSNGVRNAVSIALEAYALASSDKGGTQ